MKTLLLWLFYLYEICALLSFCWCTRLAVIVLFVRNLCFVVVLLVHSTCCDCFICTKSVLCCRFVSALDLLWLFYLYEICALLSFCWCTRLAVIVLFVWNLCFVVVLLVHSTCCDCFIYSTSVFCWRFET
jgi:hypothetical protein